MSLYSVNGVRLAYHPSDSKISAFSIYCQNGSIFENGFPHGISHFSEHMFFKGTEKRTAKDITRDFAKVGASANAYTSEDEVCYYFTVTGDYFANAAEVLCDSFYNSVYAEEDLEKERKVILVEKGMYEDDPNHEFSIKTRHLFSDNFSHDSLGTTESINQVNRTNMLQFLTKTLGRNNIMYSYCGNLPAKTVIKILEKLTPTSHRFLGDQPMNFHHDGLWREGCYEGMSSKIKILHESDKADQAVVCGYMDGTSVFSETRVAEGLLMSALGAFDFSLMYGRLREDLSLCYSVGVSCSTIQYPSHTAVALYGTMNCENVPVFIEETEKLMRKLHKDGLDKDLFELAKTATLFQILCGTETSNGRSRLLTNSHFHGRPISLDQHIDRYKTTTLEQCNELLHRVEPKNIKWVAMVNDKNCVGGLI